MKTPYLEKIGKIFTEEQRKREEDEKRNPGLYKKYEIKRTDGKEIPKDAEFFVLRMDGNDKAAREALAYYAYLTDNHNLKKDLFYRLYFY